MRGARGGTEIGRSLADALERDPLVRKAGPSRGRPLAPRDDVRGKAMRRDGGDDRGNVVRFHRKGAQPWVGKGGGYRAGGTRHDLEVGDIRRRAEPPRSACEAPRPGHR